MRWRPVSLWRKVLLAAQLCCLVLIFVLDARAGALNEEKTAPAPRNPTLLPHVPRPAPVLSGGSTKDATRPADVKRPAVPAPVVAPHTPPRQQGKKSVLKIKPRQWSHGSARPGPVRPRPGGPIASEKPGAEGRKACKLKKCKTRRERQWRIRILLSSMMLWSMQKDKEYTNKLANRWVGIDPGMQIELFGRHVIHGLIMWGMGRGFIFGGGAGYAYELKLVPNVMLLELGAVVGYFSSEISDEGGGMGKRITFLLFRPTLNIGYRSFYVSFGPRMYVGQTVILGFTAGIMFRI